MGKWCSHHVTIAPLLLLKEKWLDEDPEKISVLKYVATFNSYAAIGDYSRPLVDRYCRLWST